MFRLPKEVKDDLKNYKSSLEEVHESKISPSRFKGIRVPWGIYSHRGGKTFMNRIRIPAGAVSPSQFKALAHVSLKYGDGILHITTRQDIQIHNVRLEDTIKVMEYLKEYNLSPRGGGGNTVRNIIACPLSGISKDELFDVRNYAIALTENLLRQESSFNLPRKFKIAFSGCPKDCAGCLVNDLGFLAQYKDGRKGFKVFVGGGMGADSRIGKLLEEFVPEEDLGYCVAATENVFYKKGDRRNKHHNRLRFLIEDIGFEGFKRLYKDEFQKIKEEEHIVLRKIDFSQRECQDGEPPSADDKEYRDFLEYNVCPQRQKGFVSVELRIPRGDISAEKSTSLADLEKKFPGIEFRTSQNQNILIVWVKNKDLYKVFLSLKGILEDFLYPQTLLDVVACKGALTCNLGLCNSPGLAEAIEKVVKKDFLRMKVFKKLQIRLNGCPNACGQQPLGKLSFYGVVRRVDNRPVPFYKFLIGGRREAELTKFAEEVGILPAKNVPHFLRDFLKRTEEAIGENGDIYQFLDGAGKKIANQVLENYSYVPSYSENRDFYIDWGKIEEFSLAGLGPGECGAGVLDIIESDLTEAKIALEEAERQDYSAKEIKKALFLSSRALLIIRGKNPKTEKETFSDFKEEFINRNIASSIYSDTDEVFKGVTDKITQDVRKEKFLYAKSLFEHIDYLYKNMDSSFNFPTQKAESTKTEVGKNQILDLKGTACPLNYVKAKLFLENINAGDIVDIFLDEGEPINNVPKSLKDDGHKILKIEKQDGFYKVVVEKK